MFIALPEKNDALHILLEVSKLGLFICFSIFPDEYFNDVRAYFTLSLLDFNENKDSIACDIASIPAEALNFFGTEIASSGSIKIKSGKMQLSSTEYFTLSM